MILLSVVGCDVRVRSRTSTSPQPDGGLRSAQTATHLFVISWGNRSNVLDYVAFTGERKPAGEFTGLLVTPLTIGSTHYVLRRPDRSTVPIPGQFQLFELIDGRYRESTQRVSLATFKEFLDSHPPEYSIDSLIGFAEAQKNAK